MLKTFLAALSILVLVSCQTTTEETVTAVEPKPLPGQVVAITELCKSLENQLNIFKAYSTSPVIGMQIYYDLIYSGQCVTFQKPVLAKKVKLEFSKQIDKFNKIEIWKIALNEDEEEIKFFWTANHIITGVPKAKPKESST